MDAFYSKNKGLKTVKGDIPDDRMHLNNNNLNGEDISLFFVKYWNK